MYMTGYVELTIDAGTTFEIDLVVNSDNGTPLNLVGYESRAQMRKSYYSSSAHDFTVQITEPTSGMIRMTMAAANTALITPGRYVYDVLLCDTEEDPELVYRIFEGTVIVTPGVTRN